MARISPVFQNVFLPYFTITMRNGQESISPVEAFGGGGHQNVAGAQVTGGDLMTLRAKAIEISEKYIEENDKDESNIAAGR